MNKRYIWEEEDIEILDEKKAPPLPKKPLPLPPPKPKDE